MNESSNGQESKAAEQPGITADLIDAAAGWVQSQMVGEATGHDWWHVERVWRMARHLAEAEGAEVRLVELAALLHDIEDFKFSGDESASGRAAAGWLRDQGVDEATVGHVVGIIDGLSFKSKDQPRLPTLEGRVVQDADRLDALGAIGIARTFAYGGWNGTPLHDPTVPPRLSMSGEEYRAHRGTTVNHFYEKLLLLRDLMNTPTARRLADERHRYMEAFLARFEAEWEGEA